MKLKQFLPKIFIPLFFLAGTQTIFSQEELRILPLGNSITRGTMCTNGDIYTCVQNADNYAIGYRYRLYNLLNQAGYSVNFIGSEQFGGSLMTDPDNAGFQAIKTGALADVMETGTSTHSGAQNVTSGPYLNHYPADVILLHIGTNDVLANSYTVNNVNRILEAVDDYEASSGKPVLVFVSKIISPKGYDCHTHSGTQAFNNSLQTLVQNRKNNGDHLVLVDMECDALLDYDNDMTDQAHPNQTGYNKMADLWYQEIFNFNSAPIVESIPDQTKDRGTQFTPVQLDSYVEDIEDEVDDIQWSTIPSDPEHYTIHIDQNRIATITPKDPYWSGYEDIEFIATDNGKIIESLKKSDGTITRFSLDWIPEIIGQQSLSTAEETALTLSLDDLNIVDRDNAPGTLEIILTDGAGYNIIDNTIFPGIDFSGILQVPVKIRCNGKESESYTLSISVSSVNDAPVILSPVDPITAKEDSCFTLDLSMLNVEDPDNNYPQGFTLVVLPGDNYSYTGSTVCPTHNYNGILLVNIVVSDGDQSSEIYPLQVEILSAAPVFILPDKLDVLQDHVYNESIELDHYDPESFVYTVTEKPDWLSFDASGHTLSGVPTNEDIGDNKVVIEAVNHIARADTVFYIHVFDVNDPPLITSTPKLTAKSGIEYSYTLYAEDPDPDESLSYSYSRKPSWAGFSSSKGTLIGTPDRNDVGSYGVTLQVSDGEYTIDQNFTIVVEYHNFAPTITTSPKDTAIINSIYTYGVHAEDQENDPISYFAKDKPEWLEFYPATGVLIGTPAENHSGACLVVLGASDGIDTSYQAYRLEVVYSTSRYDNNMSLTKIYPNPTPGIVIIETSETDLSIGSLVFELYDLTGKRILTKNINESHYQINLDNEGIKEGVYLYKMLRKDTPGLYGTGKLILKK